ncbi:MAG: hypothetical protein RLY86_3713 [Pseudomonadota bacterium]|jgi:predicted aspartyl protease
MGQATNIHQLRLFLAGAAALLLASGTTWACGRADLGTLPVNVKDGAIHAEGMLDGQPILARIATATATTMLSRTAVSERGYRPLYVDKVKITGPGGPAAAFSVRLDDLSFGSWVLTDSHWLVSGQATQLTPGLFGVIGTDQLSRMDMEIDLASGRMALWQHSDCADHVLSHWDRNAVLAEIRESRGQLVTTVVVDGVALEAVIDTTSPSTRLTVEGAARLGLTAADGTVTPGDVTLGDLTLGDLTVRNATLGVADLNGMARAAYSGGRHEAVISRPYRDLVLGVDFLQANRVLIARSQGLLYFSPTGERMFRGGRTLSET